MYMDYRHDYDSIFSKNMSTHNLRSSTELSVPQINSVGFGEKSIQYLGPLIWKIVPSDLKGASSLSEFKRKIKSWRPTNCPCRLCKESKLYSDYIFA